jgi:calnexin
VDEIMHLFTLILRPDGTFETMIDARSSRNGTFAWDFDPPLYEKETIDDPIDKKPDDWVDDIFIPDPNAVKPADWDDDAPFQIPDPARLTPPPGWLVDEERYIREIPGDKPASWDDDTMGEWQPRVKLNPKCARAPGCGRYDPPTIRNKKAKGKWKARYIPNPAYKGEWRPRQIPNPNFKGQKQDWKIPPITAIGFNIWGDQKEYMFRNIIITTNETAVKQWNHDDFVLRQRRQIRAMKINYQWVDVDVPDDFPKPERFGRIRFWMRCVKRAWARVPDKPLILLVSLAVLLVTIPIVVFCCDMCSDPFAKLKQD